MAAPMLLLIPVRSWPARASSRVETKLASPDELGDLVGHVDESDRHGSDAASPIHRGMWVDQSDTSGRVVHACSGAGGPEVNGDPELCRRRSTSRVYKNIHERLQIKETHLN